MLRLPFIVLANLYLLLVSLLGAPFRMMATGHRPAYVRFRLTGDPPYRERRRRRLQLGEAAPSRRMSRPWSTSASRWSSWRRTTG